jgi:predicted ABC-type ATPase
VGTNPIVVVLSGPNGAGKSTAAVQILPMDLPFLNADEIAKTLPGYPSPAVDLQAARRVLEMLDSLEEKRASFSLETTLASRSLALRLVRLRTVGYVVRLTYLWTPSPEFSIRRVAERVRAGGHGIPEETICRRYHSGLRNLFSLYMPLSDHWEIYDNTDLFSLRKIAMGTMRNPIEILNPVIWNILTEQVSHEA